MTNEEIDAQIQAQSAVISSPHEGAAMAHFISTCRYCCLQHFMALERERCARIAENKDNWAYPGGRAEITAKEIARKIREGK